jgi:hypothetical protein
MLAVLGIGPGNDRPIPAELTERQIQEVIAARPKTFDALLKLHMKQLGQYTKRKTRKLSL